MNEGTCTWCKTEVNEQDFNIHAGEHYRKQVELMKFNPLTTVTSMSTVSYVRELK